MPRGIVGSTPQATCHPERRSHCKGLCKQCYYMPYIEKRKSEGMVFPSHTKEAKRRDHLKPLGWTPELFDRLWLEQKGRCAICNKPLNLNLIQNGSRACADHVHTVPPKPRGILCTNCNAMVGQAQENPNILRAAASYIEKFMLVSSTEETNTEQVSA